mgnify:CR=1 FL=1
MGDAIRLSLGGGAHTIHVERLRTATGLPIDALTLSHRHGAAIVWRSGDEGTIDHTLAVWRSCGARVVDLRNERGAA